MDQTRKSNPEFTALVVHAEAKFWAAIAMAFPSATNGDLPPDATFVLHNALEMAVLVWVRMNVPEDAPERTTYGLLPADSDQISDEIMARDDMQSPMVSIDGDVFTREDAYRLWEMGLVEQCTDPEPGGQCPHQYHSKGLSAEDLRRKLREHSGQA